MPSKPAKSAKQAFSRNVKMKTDEDFGKRTSPPVKAGLESFRQLHGGPKGRGKGK